MIDHLTVLVSDFERALAFYRAALAPLGYAVVMQFTRAEIPDLPAPAFAGLGAKGKPDLWLRAADGPVAPTHVAFAAPERPAFSPATPHGSHRKAKTGDGMTRVRRVTICLLLLPFPEVLRKFR